MQLHSVTAPQLVSALLDGDGSPKDFILGRIARQRQADGIKLPATWHFELCGIENSGYWTGRSTAHTRWDEVFIGAGDNPQEAAEDALNDAAEGSWEVAHLSTDGIPTQPSVSENFPGDDDQDDLSFYVALWLKEKKVSPAQQVVDSLLEAEDAKGFLKHLNRQPEQPDTWPKVERWRKDASGFGRERFKRKAWRLVNRYARQADGTYQAYQVPRRIRNTYFHKDTERKEHTVRLHTTEILKWDKDQNCYVHVGNWRTNVTQARVNQFLPHHWKIVTYHGRWYWWNQKWPPNIQDRLGRDRASRRDVGTNPWWIKFEMYDWIMADGTLRFGYDGMKDTKQGWAKPDGSVKVPGQPWRSAPVGALDPPRRGRAGFDPAQQQLRLEGRYLRGLAWINRVRAKHANLKHAEKVRKEVAEIDKPGKKRKKSGHEGMR